MVKVKGKGKVRYAVIGPSFPRISGCGSLV